jgi:hypothetical protein
MQWSQLKKQLQTRMAESVSGSIDLHQTRYRHSHDQEGEFWITLGKSRIFSSGSLSYLSSLGELAAKHRDEGASPAQAFERAWTTTEASGLMLLEQMNKDLFESLSQTVEKMLGHRNPVVRALAIIDTRYGKRRLADFDSTNEHPLIQRLYQLRCEAEGIAPNTSSCPVIH